MTAVSVTELDSSAKGRLGEELAAAALVRRGWRILERNYRTSSGEVDIVAVTDRDVIVFCEVKTWDAVPLVEAGYSVDRRKCRRILAAASSFLSERPGLGGAGIRFDLFIQRSDGSAVTHIEDAFGRE